MTKLPDTSKYKGLTEAEAENRIANGDVNISSSSPSKSVKQIILTNVFTYFNLIFCNYCGCADRSRQLVAGIDVYFSYHCQLRYRYNTGASLEKNAGQALPFEFSYG